MSYVRVSVLGTALNGEVWSVNPVFDPTGEFGVAVDQAQLDAAALAIANRTVPGNLRSAMGMGFTRSGARVEVRQDSDDALLGISVQASGTPLAGTTAVRLPQQSALVTSIRTNTPGGSGRGRLYWPAGGVTLDTNARIASATVASFLTDMKAYLIGIRGDLATAFPLIGFDLAVRSKTTHTTPHAVRIQAGDVVDTQRRRRDAIPESYQQLAFP